MTINVDASYENKRFAISSVIYNNGTARSFFLPMKFRLCNYIFYTNQVIAELYAIYAAVKYSKGDVEIYTDSESICKMLNGTARPCNRDIHAFIKIINKTCLSRNIKFIYISRTYNKMANNISLYMLRSIKSLQIESTLKSKKNLSVVNIDLEYTVNRFSELYNIYISKSVEVVVDGVLCKILEGYCTSCSTNFKFKERFNWLKLIRR